MDVPLNNYTVRPFRAEDRNTPDDSPDMSSWNNPRYRRVLTSANLTSLAGLYQLAALKAAYPELSHREYEMWTSYFTEDITHYRVVPGGIPEKALECLGNATELGLSQFCIIRCPGIDETVILGIFEEHGKCHYFLIVAWHRTGYPAVTNETLEAHYAAVQTGRAQREATEKTRRTYAALERHKEARKTTYLAYPTWIVALASLAVINYLFYTLIGGWVLAPAIISALFCAERIDASRFHFINSRRKLVRKIAIPLLILNLFGGASVWLAGVQLGVDMRAIALCSKGPNYEYSTDGQTYFTPDGVKYTLTLTALDELDGYQNIEATVTYVKHGLYGTPEVTAITHVQDGSEACYPAEALEVPLPL
jgi:hypothetical protein